MRLIRLNLKIIFSSVILYLFYTFIALFFLFFLVMMNQTRFINYAVFLDSLAYLEIAVFILAFCLAVYFAHQGYALEEACFVSKEIPDRASFSVELLYGGRVSSGGMKRRVGIATALIGNPQMVVLDEPTAGIDPKERIAFYKTIRECFAGRNVLISTRILDDIEILADNVVMLARGEVTYSGSYAEFRNSLNGRLFQIAAEAGDPPIDLSGCRVLSAEKQGATVYYRVVGYAGMMPGNAVPIQPSTEDIWLYYQGGADDVGQAG